MLFVGVDPTPPLRSLHAAVAAALAPLGVEPEARPFVPHVTLALGLSETEAHQMVGAARAQGLAAEFTADHIWLKRNDPGRPAAAENEMEAFPLDSSLLSG